MSKPQPAKWIKLAGAMRPPQGKAGFVPTKEHNQNINKKQQLTIQLPRKFASLNSWGPENCKKVRQTVATALQTLSGPGRVDHQTEWGSRAGR